MKKENELLREACAEIAREETERLDRSLTMEEIRRAEDMYREHRDAALRQIRGKRGTAGRRYLYAAAVLLLLAGGVWLTWGRAMPDNTPAAQPPAASVAPYLTPAAASPTETPSPTETRIPAVTGTPAPTERTTSAPAETITPTDTPVPAADSRKPEGWEGLYFPQALPEGYNLKYLRQEDGRHTAAWARDGRELLFTEYESVQPVTVEAGAECRYVPLPDGSVALLTETDAGMMLIWDRDGRTLCVACEEADAEEIAVSVKKVAAE
ncbi:MAG: hypothetical protein J5472_00260 [Clostridia bacterium]|nr:hypothetical protein [Clostridia bacterium]